jgi:hypothetical protein
MLRLPGIRACLSAEPSEALGDMFESYFLAADALDRLMRETPKQPSLIAEYTELCREIEQEVLIHCTDKRQIQHRLK